jgi:hypothetical protein
LGTTFATIAPAVALALARRALFAQAAVGVDLVHAALERAQGNRPARLREGPKASA